MQVPGILPELIVDRSNLSYNLFRFLRPAARIIRVRRLWRQSSQKRRLRGCGRFCESMLRKNDLKLLLALSPLLITFLRSRLWREKQSTMYHGIWFTQQAD